MNTDPKQIVTPFAFEVHPELLGLPLAAPKRRLAALLTDLLIASILTALGAFFLAFSASILFFWLALRNRGSIWWKNLLRYGAASFISILVFVLTLNLADNDNSIQDVATLDTLDGEIVTGSTDQIDWGALVNDVARLSKNDSIDIEDQIEKIAEDLEAKLSGTSRKTDNYPSEMFEASFILNLRDLGFAISNKDSLSIDTLKAKIVPILATVELGDKNERISELVSRIDRLEGKNEILEEKVENPGLLATLKSTAEDFGLSVGWVGIYFVLCTALFKGQTLGKRIFNLRVVRLNNRPIGLLYSFERFGGYAAGIATGLLGFAQVYWDANRQAIHDKIATTVVIDTRKKTTEKYQSLRKEILREQNLLD